METLSKRRLSQHPHFFGNYLNMARHNAFNILKYLSEKYQTPDADHIGISYEQWMHLDPTKREFADDSHNETAKLFDILEDKLKRPEVVDNLIRDLMRHFPFLKYLYGDDDRKPREVSPNAIRKDMVAALQLLNNLRNAFAHYSEQNKYFCSSFPFNLVYKSAVVRLPQRFKDLTEHVKHLNYEPAEPQAGRVHLLEKPTTKNQKKKGKNKRKTVPFPEPTEGGYPISEKTLAFFTCLFLERKYATEFLKELDGFDSAGTLADRATVELYKLFCSQLPQPRLESGDVMLDMLVELGKCPDKLYPQLSKEDKKTFIPKADSANSLPVDETEVPEVDTNGDEGTSLLPRKRHEDRFPPFALRYFDDTKAFPTLRFQLQLGKKRIGEPYSKEIMGIEDERQLLKPIRTFARLGYSYKLYENVLQGNPETGTPIEGLELRKGKKTMLKKIHENYRKRFPESWITSFKEEDNSQPQWYLKSEIDQFSPFYNLQENNIGIKFITLPSDDTMPDPDKTFPDLDQDNEQPDAFLSTYELQSLFLYDYFYKDETINTITESTESFIKHYMERIRLFLKEVKDGKFALSDIPPQYKKGDTESSEYAALQDRKALLIEKLKAPPYHLELNAIPGDVREYLLAYLPPQYLDKAQRKISLLQAEITERRNKVADKRPPKVGQMATWLTENLQLLTPPRRHKVAGKDDHFLKLNNEQFRQLQKALAHFETNKKIIDTELKHLNLTQGDLGGQHPFLSKIDVLKCPLLIDFYKAYLKECQKWLDTVAKYIEDHAQNEQAIKDKYGYLLPMATTRDANKDRINKAYERMPVMLPRGLFKTAIDAAMKEKGYQNKDESYTIINTPYALDLISKNDTQQFYNFERFVEHTNIIDGVKYKVTYNIEDDLERIEDDIERYEEQESLSEEDLMDLEDFKKRKNKHYKVKQLLRYTQANDRALWLMVKKRAEYSDGGEREHPEIDFKALSLDKLETVLETIVNVQLTIGSVIIKDELPIRRYGDFRRFLKDLRLTNLLQYKMDEAKDEMEKSALEQTQGIEIKRSHIEEELELYDRLQPSFFEKVYQFEKAIYKHFKSDLPILDKDKKYYNHHDFLDIALTRLLPMMAEPIKQSYQTIDIRELRNKILHNEIPYFDWLTDAIKRQKVKEAASQSKFPEAFSKSDKKNRAYVCYWIFKIANRQYDTLLNLLDSIEKPVAAVVDTIA